ncbi:MAG: ectoine/hydroxyectoine ABC transporter permease subunit EhuC [Dehalococcoidia bacterium]
MLDGDVIQSLVNGTWLTIRLTLVAVLLGTGMSILSGLASLSPWRGIRAVNRVYVDFFRGTSAIVQLFWIFFALPLVGISLSAFAAGVVTLGLNMGSYGSEVVRGAILAVPKGQMEAAVSLNLSTMQRMRHVIFPQAIVAMLPPYGNLLIELLKATALVSLITLSDLAFEAQKLRELGVASTTVLFSTILVIYFVLALGITGLVRLAERFFSRGLDIRRTVRRPTP